MATLVEKYASRINYADKYCAKLNEGRNLSASAKLGLAQVLENTAKLFDTKAKLNEAFENSVSGQRADLGAFKITAWDITTLVNSNLIADQLVLIKPLSSFHGRITYTEYVYGSNKGDVKIGDLISNPFQLTNAHPDYTSAHVEENHEVAAEATEIALGWGPVVPGSIAFQIGADKYFDAAGKLYKGTFASKRMVLVQEDGEGHLEGVAGHYDVNPGDAVEVGTVTYGFARSAAQSGAIYDKMSPKITFTATPFAAEAAVAISYLYNNVAVMQNDIPTLVPRIKAIDVLPKVRRIAANYSNLEALQYKMEYNRDLGKEIADKAVHQLKWEIDTEIVDFLVKNAGPAQVVFNAVPRTGLSLSQQYEGFAKTIDEAKAIVYNKTKMFNPNYMIIARNVLTVLQFVEGFKEAAEPKRFMGPYLAGTFMGLKVYVHPIMADDTFVLGVNDAEFDTSAAAYCPFVTIVPTQLLETPDGANMQGWSTAYGLVLLDANKLVAGMIERTASDAIFSGDIVRVQA